MPATLLSRFLRYVRVDTQSSENSASTPSTLGQWVLLRMLEQELKELGVEDVHLIQGGVDRTEISFILRDFELSGLKDKATRLKGLCRGLQASQPRARITCQLIPQYRNMAYWLKRDMTPVKLADEAIRALGLEPHSTPTRGGTDGSRLTERGLPAPNLFNGSHNWHGPLEWVCVQDMDLAVKMCVELVQLWEKKGAGYAGWGTKKRRRSRTRAASTNGRWAKFSCTSRLTSIICASGFVRQKPSGPRPCRRMNHSPHLRVFTPHLLFSRKLIERIEKSGLTNPEIRLIN